jgi:hypothetical protein
MRYLVAFIMLIAGLAFFWVNFNIVYDYLVICQTQTPLLSGSEIVFYLAGILIALLISWLLSSLDHNMATINLCGTKLHGRTLTPSGYISTKWLVIGGLPIIPVQSYEVLAEKPAGMGASYALTPREELEWGQITRTALTGFSILFGIELIAVLFFNWIICFYGRP